MTNLQPRVGAALLDYRRLLWLLSREFSGREFTTAEASGFLAERYNLLGFFGMNLRSTGLRPKLVSTALGRLRRRKWVEARRVPRSVTTRLGKRANRGFMNVWHIVPWALDLLRTVKTDPVDPRWFLRVYRKEQHKLSIREDPEYVYGSVIAFNAEIDFILSSGHEPTREERQRLKRRVKEYHRLTEEIMTLKPKADVMEALQRALADARRSRERDGPT